ncbi:alpha/beta hydrolase family protein [Roseibium aggregatum]|uniref:Alpha/beta fold hydrolase n=1 Tax=Roseibium aggregatum TaxID=187304 RepID=A0A939J6J6_9HYPH|nr:alpha/beta fold hydrolase [Roseibium aggregatum]MBN9673350.1 alpha/beta fold hydrolase [Roseibium aggregatum]
MKHLLFAFLLLASSAAAAGNEDLAGYDRFAVSAAHRPALLQGFVWYPAGTRTYAGFIGKGPVFKGTKALVGAGVKVGRYPLVVFSHGSGGNVDAVSWLGSAFAAQGIMVVGVNHPGSTSGDSSPRRSLQPSERAGDLSAALDHLLADPYFARFIDPDRIVALGFSLGGATVLNMAGVTFDPETYKTYCDLFGLEQAVDCAFFVKGDVDLTTMAGGLRVSGKDERISAVVAIDPGFTYAVRPQSIDRVDVPVQLISLGKEYLWPATDVGPEGSGLVSMLNNVDHVSLSPAHHFTFLGECTGKGAAILEEEQDDPVCDDPAGTDRAGIHEQIVKAASRFISQLK